MDRRIFLVSLIGGVAATSTLGVTAAAAAPVSPDMSDLNAVRSALMSSTPVEMQRGRGGGGRGGRGGGFRGGGFRGGGFRGGGFRRGWGGGGWRRGGWGWRRRGWGGPGWGWRRRRRCWINRWGEWVCRRPIWW